MDMKISPETPATKASSTVSAGNRSNALATAIMIIGSVIDLCAFFAGIMLGQAAESFMTMLLFWVAGILSGTLMLGFSEVIRLLHEINQKMK